MLEFYQAYADYHDLMDMVERIFQGLADTVVGTRQVEYQGETFDFGSAFRRVTVEDLVVQHVPGFDRSRIRDVAYLRERLRARSGSRSTPPTAPASCRSRSSRRPASTSSWQPTFVYAYPAEVSPLARRNDQDPFITDRFEFFVGGRELANGFSELNDPDDQAARFREQVARKSRATRRRCSTTRTTCARSSMGCRPRRGSASASTAW